LNSAIKYDFADIFIGCGITTTTYRSGNAQHIEAANARDIARVAYTRGG
jgi:hypothetical protein